MATKAYKVNDVDRIFVDTPDPGGVVVLPIFTEATRPAAGMVPDGTIIFNSDDLDINVAFGGDWYLNGIPT